MIKVWHEESTRIRQGDILRDIRHLEYLKQEAEYIELSEIIFPLVIVLTQDCDLEQNKEDEEREKQDKHLMAVLVAPVYNAEQVFLGQHLSEIDLAMEPIHRDRKNFVKKNQSPRYYYLEFPEECRITPSVVDFKHYFSLSLEYLEENYAQQFICCISELFRESISQRFSNYLARIALPD
jgi:hypothetical protein